MRLREAAGSTVIYSDDIFISRDKANTFYYMDVLKLNPFKDKSIGPAGCSSPKFIEIGTAGRKTER